MFYLINMDDKKIAIIVLSALSALVFFVLLAVVLYTHCSRRFVDQRDPYIVATFLLLCVCFLSRTVDLIFTFDVVSPQNQTCVSITSNVVPYCFITLAATVNLNRWVHVTRLCTMIAQKAKRRPRSALCARDFLNFTCFVVLGIMLYGVFAACYYGNDR